MFQLNSIPEAKQEEVERDDHGSQGALGVSDESQYFESSLEIENDCSSVW